MFSLKTLLYVSQNVSMLSLDDPYGDIGFLGKFSWWGGLISPNTAQLDANKNLLTLLILEASI